MSRELSDQQIVDALEEAAAAHEELLSTVGKITEALKSQSERLDALQKKVLDLDKRLSRARH